MTKKLIVSIAFMVTACSLRAQNITGAWYGVLKLPAGQLHLVYHLVKTGDTYTATMDSPDQGANGLPMDNVDFTQNKLTITSVKYGLKYTGNYVADSNKFVGTFSQGALNAAMELTAAPVTAAPVVISRPQDPKDFPYKQEEVSFTNPKAGDVLAGTLTLPANGQAKRLVILITGSGPQNRNEELAPFNQRPFLVWSDWLTRQGIAVLRYDDRGIEKSTGIFNTATTADFADDAEAAVNYVLSRLDLKKMDIGLMGHSEGGMIAPMLAASDKNVKFVVMLAGPGVPIKDLMVQQNADALRLSGVPDSTIASQVKSASALYGAMIQYNSLPNSQYKHKIDSVLYSGYPKSEQGMEAIINAVKKTSAQLTSPWFRYFINAVPADYLVKVKCPVLALDGTLDSQVKSGPNLLAINDALKKGGNKHFETLSMPGLNHLFQKAVTGSVNEYGQISETVNPAALQKVSDWINGL